MGSNPSKMDKTVQFSYLSMLSPELRGPIPEPGPSIPDETFTPFPSLPAELRLKVWRLILPEPAVVNLDFERFASVGGRHNLRPQDHIAQLPVTLHVCRESREETLCCYTLIHRGDSGIEPAFAWGIERRPLFVNPRLDKIHISYTSLQSIAAPGFCCLLEYLDRQCPELLRSVKVLEVRDCDWDAEVEASKGRQLAADNSITPLLKFRRLKTLYLTAKFYDHKFHEQVPWRPWDVAKKDEGGQMIKEFLAMNALRFDGGKAPGLVQGQWPLRDWIPKEYWKD